MLWEEINALCFMLYALEVGNAFLIHLFVKLWRIRNKENAVINLLKVLTFALTLLLCIVVTTYKNTKINPVTCFFFSIKHHSGLIEKNRKLYFRGPASRNGRSLVFCSFSQPRLDTYIPTWKVKSLALVASKNKDDGHEIRCLVWKSLCKIFQGL